MKTIRDLLRQYGLRHTQNRADILSIFLNQEIALSGREVEERLQARCDRVTVYRTLSTFLEKGILHKVLSNVGAMKYALCSIECHNQAHRHDHVHFKCVSCGQTACLEAVPIPEVSLPTGYHLQEVNVLLEGVCPACREEAV